MSATNYKRYVRDTLALAQSLTIKSELSVIGINQYVEALGHTVSNDPTTWKYYLNLAGESHFLDVPMSVQSLDNRTTIAFTPDNLAEHLVTREYYQPGTWRYRQLVDAYPEQELLIRGTLHPVDMQTAIDAPDFTILDWDAALVESNETNVLDELQRRVYEFNVRWNNPSYAVNDDLYVAANLAILYGRLTGWLFNIRLDNCRTRHVHGFHIREFLKSHGRLDRYFDYLSRGQALWLYRNLLYLERNAGKQNTFGWLTENILTRRGLGLAEYNINHNLAELPNYLRPRPEFIRSGLNRFHRSTRNEEHTFEELLFKQRPQAIRNAAVETATLKDDTRLIQNAKRDTLRTKALESSIIDWSESGVVLRLQFLMNHWAYWSATGHYHAIIRPPHPRTGESMEMKVEDAFLTYLYTYNRSVGVTLSQLPGYTAQCIRREPTPSFDTLRGLADRKLVSDDWIRLASRQQVKDYDLLSPYQFVKKADHLHDDYYAHREIYSLREDHRVRGQLQGVFDHLYMHVDTPFTDLGESYEDWFLRKGLDLTDLSVLEYESLSYRILEDATGIRLNSNDSPAAVQRAMVGIMRQLSSYNVHYIQEVNPGPIVFWDWLANRIGGIAGYGSARQRTNLLSQIPSGVNTKGFVRVQNDLNALIQREYGIRGKIGVEQPVNVRFDSKDYRKDFVRLPMARSRFDIPSMACK